MFLIKRWVILGIALTFLFGNTAFVYADSDKQEAEKKTEETGKQASKSAQEQGAETGEALKETGKALGEGTKKVGKDIGGFFKGLTKGKEDTED